MPAFALILAGYAAYAKYEQSKLAKYDDTISLEGKSSIALLPTEQEMSILQYPICTITFFEGDAASVAPFLERRIEEILAANPWLSGWLIRDAADVYRVKIYYDGTAQDRCKGGGHFEVVSEPFVPLPVTQNKNEVRIFEALLAERNLIVPINFELIGRDRPFWKVAVVPCLDDPTGKFALVVSMSHAAGDAHTYYRLFQMLDVESSVVALDARRVPFREALEAMSESRSGDTEYLAQATKHPLLDLSTGGSGSSADDPIVMKTFFVDEDWILDRKSERQSVFVTPDKIADHAQGGEGPSRDAGSNNNRGGKIATVVSLNSILTSWFFQLNGASIGLMAVNVRHRLDDCELGEDHAGNYVTTIPYTPDDYRTPGRIQQSLRRLQRCGNPGEPPKDLPPLSWSMTCSLSNDWSRWFRDELYLHDDVSLKLHMPLWHTEFVASLPSRFSSLHMFTAQPEGIDGRERRLGATVLCRKSVWGKIQESGVVEEMIVDF